MKKNKIKTLEWKERWVQERGEVESEKKKTGYTNKTQWVESGRQKGYNKNEKKKEV